MIAVICAAGVGSRFKSISGDKPKPLFELNGRSLIKRQLDLLTQNGIKKIIIVVGYKAEMFKETIGNNYNGAEIIYVFNENYFTKGNMSSLWAARNYINEDLIFTVGDLIISGENVKRICESTYEGSMIVDVSEEAKKKEDPLKAKTVNGKIVALNKTMKPEEAHGAAEGYYKFKLDVAKKFYKLIENHFKKGEIDLPFNVPIEELCQVQEVYPVHTDGTLALDIDTPEDLYDVSKKLKEIEKE